MLTEYSALIKNGTWTLVDLPKGGPLLAANGFLERNIMQMALSKNTNLVAGWVMLEMEKKEDFTYTCY